METVWATALPSGDVCASGGYDALITCWRVSGAVANHPPTAVMSATPRPALAPLTVTFDGSAIDRPRRHGGIVGVVVRGWELRHRGR